MFARLFLLFTVVPALELYLLMHVGRVLGPLNTLLLVLITGALGAAMARNEGFSIIQRITEDAQRGVAPTDKLAEGLLILVGGILLVTPGILTDLVGFSFIMPWTRQRIVPALKEAVAARVTVMDGVDIGAPRPGPQAQKNKKAFEHPVQ